jgi:TonB-dependent receptor
VPAGSQTITVSYIGRAPQRQDVSVAAGQTVTVNFSAPLAAVVLEGVRVVGSRAQAQAEALNRQANAPNIMNIVASDQIGRFPDWSAPEAVQRLPGIAVERDQGEGRYIQIRGSSAANTHVSFNGVSVPSPEGDVRQIALDAVPVDLLESIEVTKTILPDMDADAVGGSVNLVTRRPPSQRLISAEIAGGFATIRNEPAGSGSLTLGDRFGDGRLGVLVSGSYSRRRFGSDNVEPEYDLGDPGLEDDALEELQVRHYTLWRARLGGTAAIDYRLGEQSSVMLTGTFSEMQDEEQRRRTISVIEDGELSFRHKSRRENIETYNVTLSGDHLLPRDIVLDYRFAYAHSEEDTPFDSEGEFIMGGVTFSPVISDPASVRSNPSTVSGPYVFDAWEPASSQTANRDYTGAVNLAVPYALGRTAGGRIKVGFKAIDRRKTQDLVEEAYELASGPDIILGQDLGEAFALDNFNPGPYAFSPYSTTPAEIVDFGDLFADRLDGEEDLESETEDYDLEERILAGYAMAEINVTPSLLLVAGARYEHTNVETNGFEFDPDAETITPTSGSNKYGKLFPMAHLRYALGPSTNARAAFTTTIQRPNFYDLVPYRIRDDEDRELGNPDLKPSIARGVDLMFEHYDRRIGVLSAGAFYRWVNDPIFVFTTENDLGGQDEQPGNGESGTVWGVEAAVQQQLRFLPAPLDGLGFYGNYTFTSSDATLPGGRVGRLQGQADHVFNAALSYERGVFSAQVSVNYHDDYLAEYGGDEGTPDEAFEDVYIDQHFQLDASLSIRTSLRSVIFAEVVNLTNEPFRAYQGVTERPIQIEYYERWGRLGFRFSW